MDLMKKLLTQEQPNQAKGDKNLVIPERFIRIVDAHMLGNMLDIPNYPLILAIVGRPGMGKTYQLRNYLKVVDVSVFSISAADLESDRAGAPAKLLQQKYIEASDLITNGIPAALLIDDIDTTLGEWENHTGTVNHQDILAFLMHIADDPHSIENVGKVNRVPIFFTGNNFNLLYKPLIREGRANRYDWEPTREEKISIVTSIFSLENPKIAEALVDSYPTEKISFFSNLIESKKMEDLSMLANNVVFKYILTNNDYRDNLYSQYCELAKKFPWESVINEKQLKQSEEDIGTVQSYVDLGGDSN